MHHYKPSNQVKHLLPGLPSSSVAIGQPPFEEPVSLFWGFSFLFAHLFWTRVNAHSYPLLSTTMLSPTHVPALFKDEALLQESVNNHEAESWTKIIRQLAQNPSLCSTKKGALKAEDIAKRLSEAQLLPSLCEEWQRIEQILPDEILEYVLQNHTIEQILSKIHLSTIRVQSTSNTGTTASHPYGQPISSPTLLAPYLSAQTNYHDWTSTMLAVVRRNIILKENHTLWFHGSPCCPEDWENGVDLRMSRYNGEFSVHQSFYLTQNLQFALSHAIIGKVTPQISGTLIIAQIPNGDSRIWSFEGLNEYDRHTEWQQVM